jgi:hypothetical protein
MIKGKEKYLQTGTLRELKRLYKEFGGNAGILEDSLAEGRRKL